MALFEYLGVLLSVVFGLGLTHVLIGISKTIQNRGRVQVYWIHLGWSLNVVLYLIAIWWGMFWWSGVEQWSFFQFLFIILYAIVLFLVASLLYPFALPKRYDFQEHFYRNRRWFFGFQAMAWLLDIPETVMKAEGGLRALPEGYALFVGVLFALAVIGSRTKNPRYHAFYVIFWPIWTLGFLSLTTLREIVAFPLG